MTPAPFAECRSLHSPDGKGSGRPVVLALMGAYWPGSESTGPNLSLKEMCRALAGEFEFKLLARDRPFGAATPAVASGLWIEQGFAAARYCSVSRTGAEGLRGILCETPHDMLWLNGFFDREFTLPALMLRRLGRIPRRPTLLSPRGEMAGGALGLKVGRKSAWLMAARHTGLLADVWLHATGPRERQDIEARFPWSKGIVEAPNVRAMIAPVGTGEPTDGDVCRLAFVGRIARVKNLDYALSALRGVGAKVSFDIYGPIQDAAYWAECRRLIAALPANISAVHKGEIANADVPDIFAATDMLFLPTKGENFGHAIFEALACGVPVLISDQTPWQDLEGQRAGWSLPLADVAGFSAVIDAFASMTVDQRARLALGARGVAERWHRDSGAVAKSRAMFKAVLAATPSAAPRQHEAASS